MKKLNPIYLWYSVILLFPPVHEWGHVIIAWLTGAKVVSMNWFSVSFTIGSPLQDLWEYSPLIAPVCIIIWGELSLRKYGLSFLKIRRLTSNEAQ